MASNSSDLLSKSLDEIIKERKGTNGGRGERSRGSSRGRSRGGGGPIRREKKSTIDTSAPFTSASKNVFVGTFSWSSEVNEEEQNAQVQALFEEVGIRDVEEVSLEGKAGGNMFLLCRFSTTEQAKAAIEALNGKVVPFARKPIVAREDRGTRSSATAASTAASTAKSTSGTTEGSISELASFKVEIPNNRGFVSGGRHSGSEPIVILKKSHPDHPSHGNAAHGSAGFRIKVDGIPWSFVDEELKKTFDSFGKVVDARVARRRDGKSDGWGTVTFLRQADMQRAIREMDGAIIQGGGVKAMTLVVTEDQK